MSVTNKSVGKGESLGLNPAPWAWYFTKTFSPAQRRLMFSYTCCLLICLLNANTTEWICMQISRSIVNGPKSNNWVSVGICVIVCVHKPSHHLLQTVCPLRMFKIVFRDSSLYPKQLSLFRRCLYAFLTCSRPSCFYRDVTCHHHWRVSSW